MDNIYKLFRLLPVVVGAALAIGLLVFYLRSVQSLDTNVAWAAAGICAVTFAVVAILRFGLGSLGSTDVAAPVADDVVTRQRIAPLVIGIGTSGIAAIALAAIVAVNTKDTDGKYVIGVFSSVLPVFATWVGAVIAFYFSNESFRIAAQAAGAPGMTADNGALTGPARMIPYEKITKIELPSTLDKSAIADANALGMDKVRALFGDTISRIIVFDAKRRAIYVLRKKLDDTSAKTVADYMAIKQNTADAKNFRILPLSATVADGVRTLELYKTLDIFITDHGAADEPVTGWVPDDKLA
ncbi:hypothetical protein ACFSQT_10690 [Mesorhizobium calcicola]|uniref:Uncharacterized protein n=1 Tax=Mesorhizobium calcicola TaxID=1300310 RepID=A0ABW4WA89_9HYPH